MSTRFTVRLHDKFIIKKYIFFRAVVSPPCVWFGRQRCRWLIRCCFFSSSCTVRSFVRSTQSKLFFSLTMLLCVELCVRMCAVIFFFFYYHYFKMFNTENDECDEMTLYLNSLNWTELSRIEWVSVCTFRIFPYSVWD